MGESGGIVWDSVESVGIVWRVGDSVESVESGGIVWRVWG